MIEIETQCPDCGHGESDHLEVLPSARRPEPLYGACLVCGCRRYVGVGQDEIDLYKARCEADEIG